MKNISPLNDVQRNLVEENLFVVKLAIRSAVVVNETIYGFEYGYPEQSGIHIGSAGNDAVDGSQLENTD